MRPLLFIGSFAAVAALTGCGPQLEAPRDPGVCWHLVSLPNGKVRFNRLAADQPAMEHCAAQLEAMRIRFAGMGSRNDETVGAYQGNFIFIDKNGVFTAKRYDSARFPFMVRTGDGRLAVPGAMPSQ